MLNRVYVEITNVCNLSCAFCPGTKREGRFLSPEEFRVIAEKLRGHRGGAEVEGRAIALGVHRLQIAVPWDIAVFHDGVRGALRNPQAAIALGAGIAGHAGIWRFPLL